MHFKHIFCYTFSTSVTGESFVSWWVGISLIIITPPCHLFHFSCLLSYQLIKLRFLFLPMSLMFDKWGGNVQRDICKRNRRRPKRKVVLLTDGKYKKNLKRKKASAKKLYCGIAKWLGVKVFLLLFDEWQWWSIILELFVARGKNKRILIATRQEKLNGWRLYHGF